MKVNLELDCTPEEMRRMLGLPDVADVNKAYMDSVANAMKGAGSMEQLEQLAKNIAPMGEMGLRLFQTLLESGVNMGKSSKK